MNAFSSLFVARDAMSRRVSIFASLVLAAAFVISAGFLQAVRADEPTRTWTDASDRYQIEARLIGHEGGTVRLKQADDSIVEIALDQLSEADRKYVADYDAGNPFLRGMKPSGAAPAIRPPMPNSPARIDSAPQADAPSSTSGEEEATEIDWAGVPSIDVPVNGELSSLQIAPAADGPALTERTIGLPDLRDFLEQAGALVVDGPSGTALFSASHSQRDQGSTVLAEIDLANGTATERVETTGAYRVLAWDPTTKRALITSAARDPRVRRMVEVWSLDADGATKGLVVDPSDDSRPSIRSIRWGCFLPNERFALLSDRGRFSVWSLDANVPIAASSTDGYRAAAISPDRALVALATNDSVTFLDTAQLKIVGRLKGSLAGDPGAGGHPAAPPRQPQADDL